MKIIFVSHYAPSVINFRGALIEALCAEGADVKVFAPDWDAKTAAEVRAIGAEAMHYDLSRSGLNPLGDLVTLFQLRRKFMTLEPDVVFTHAAKTNVWGVLAAAMAGVPRRIAMVEGMGYAFTVGAGGKLIKRYLLRLILSWLYWCSFKLAHVVIVLNDDDARELHNICGLEKSKTTVLGGIGVRLDEWPCVPSHTRPMTFTMIARLLREKGVIEYLEAAREVKALYPQVRFRLLGSLDDNPGALGQDDVAGYVSDGIIDWPGQVNVKPWLAETSVYVLPSYREGVPRSTQEAMAMGRPVITTDVPGCRDTVINDVNGFIIPARDIKSLKEAMLKFVRNPSIVEKMGSESRRLAEERFNVEVINQRLMNLLRSSSM